MIKPSTASKPRTNAKSVAFVKWFRTAAPYIHQFRGKTFVIAFGGEVLIENEFMELAHDINVLVAMGVRLVMVHGARPQIEDQLRQHNVEPRYHLGRRITDDAALRCVKEANGIVRMDIEALLSTELANSPMADSDIRVSSGNFVTAKPVGVLGGIDFQHTGEVRKVDVQGINRRLDDFEVVLISPVGFSPTGAVFNLTLEDVATSIASALKADKLVFLMDAPGVTDAKGKFISELTVEAAEALIKVPPKKPAWHEDVQLYLPAGLRACRAGVGRVHLISRHIDGAPLLEFFTNHGIGTLLLPASPEEIRWANRDDVDGIVSIIEPLEQKGVLVFRDREKLRQEVERFLVLELEEDREKKIIGCCAVYHFPAEQTAELACVAVNPFYRDGGRGERVLQAAEREAKKLGCHSVFVLSTQTMQWFIERGFSEVDVDALPAKKQALYNFERRSKIFRKPL